MSNLKWYKIVTDCILLAIVGTPIIILNNLVYPFKRGFYCGDSSILYPFKESTVPYPVVVGIGLGLPIITFIICESVIYVQCKKGDLSTRYHATKRLHRMNVHPLVFLLYYVTGVFLFGALVTQVTTDTVKYTVGRLRPHFIAVCEPNQDLYNCSDGYIDWDVCSGDDELVQAARLSFPSGHSSFSWFCAVYFVVYLEARFVWDFSHLLKPVLQLGAIVLALLTALSRVSDYKHHWSDVMAGSLLGGTVAVILFFYTSNLLKFPRPSTNAREEDATQDGFESYPIS